MIGETPNTKVPQQCIMEKLRIIALLIVFGLTLNYATAQCNSKKDLSSPEFITQDPSAKAALIAAADDTIEERVDNQTGRKYYVRRYVSPWSGEPGYHFLSFDAQLEEFVPHHVIAFHGGEEDGGNNKTGVQTPACQEQRDSTEMQKRKLLPEDAAPVNRQPRRSSRVKLASIF